MNSSIGKDDYWIKVEITSGCGRSTMLYNNMIYIDPTKHDEEYVERVKDEIRKMLKHANECLIQAELHKINTGAVQRIIRSGDIYCST